MRSSPGPRALFVLPAVFLAVATLVAPPASGQTTTAQVRGTVTDAQGPIPSMPVVAVNTATGARFSAATATNGGYVLVLPAATYELSVTTGAHAPWKRNVQVGVGQSLTLDVALQPASIAAEVAVVATAAEAQVERVTSEVATNVSEIQIQSLPQSSGKGGAPEAGHHLARALRRPGAPGRAVDGVQKPPIFKARRPRAGGPPLA